jgi:hypothetical protein
MSLSGFATGSSEDLSAPGFLRIPRDLFEYHP